MSYGKIKMADGSNVLFEIDEQYVGEVSDDGIVQGLQQKFSSVFNLAKTTAENAYGEFLKIEEKTRPDAFEVSFGIKLTGEAGVVFAKAGTEGTFQITLKWNARRN